MRGGADSAIGGLRHKSEPLIGSGAIALIGLPG
jgi:hypothetical protein